VNPRPLTSKWTVEISVTRNKFAIILNQKGKQVKCNYTLADTDIAIKWFHKIKHLKNIPIDPIESELLDLSNLQNIYSEFCSRFNLDEIKFEDIKDQKNLNHLHEIYEKNHDRVSRLKQNKLLYKFHHAIHKAEQDTQSKSQINVGWGVKEGLLTETFPCYDHYANRIVKNNIYLSWAELGKRPVQYYRDQEPSLQERVNELCRPHVMFRAKFFIALSNIEIKDFDNSFVQWFEQFKESWLKAHNLTDYTEKDHYSAPLLATANHNIELDDAEFVKIVI